MKMKNMKKGGGSGSKSNLMNNQPHYYNPSDIMHQSGPGPGHYHFQDQIGHGQGLGVNTNSRMDNKGGLQSKMNMNINAFSSNVLHRSPESSHFYGTGGAPAPLPGVLNNKNYYQYK